MGTTFLEALSKVGATVPEHLIADAEVPVLTGPQAQGDLMIVPTDKIVGHLESIPTAGVQVVFGEATGNSHFLHQGFESPDVKWARVDDGLVLAVVSVPEGQSAQLIHTDEHGANGIGPGLYEIHAKRELRDEITRVQD
jgi:hypothetical protein